jgi:hypothetical protein
VRAKFPLRSQEDTLIRVLDAQGFASDFFTGLHGKRMTFRSLATRRQCDIVASIWWETDSEGRISDIDGRYLRSFGC